MRRTDIINAVENVLRALRESGFTSVVETLRGPGDRGPFDLDVRRLEPDVVEKLLPQILKCFAEYKVISSSFSDLEIRILNILGIEYLGDSEFWSEIFQQVRERPAFELVRLTYDIHNSTTFLPTFLKLLQQEDIPQEFFEKDRDKRLQNEISGLTIILIEEKGQRSSPDRLIEVLHSVRKLYDVCARLEKSPTNDLAVVGCDSGSDKSFDLVGLSRVMERVRGVLSSMWDRVVFYRETQASLRIKNIAESLPVLKEISDLNANGDLGQEEAEILRRQILDSTTQFLEAGAVIPEFYEQSTYAPRQLLAPEAKLLAKPQRARKAGSADTNEGAETGDDESELNEKIKDLGPDERRRLIEKLKKSENDE